MVNYTLNKRIEKSNMRSTLKVFYPHKMLMQVNMMNHNHSSEIEFLDLFISEANIIKKQKFKLIGNSSIFYLAPFIKTLNQEKMSGLTKSKILLHLEREKYT